MGLTGFRSQLDRFVAPGTRQVAVTPFSMHVLAAVGVHPLIGHRAKAGKSPKKTEAMQAPASTSMPTTTAEPALSTSATKARAAPPARSSANLPMITRAS